MERAAAILMAGIGWVWAARIDQRQMESQVVTPPTDVAQGAQHQEARYLRILRRGASYSTPTMNRDITRPPGASCGSRAPRT